MTVTVYRGEQVWTHFDPFDRMARHESPHAKLVRTIFDWQRQPGCTRIVVKDDDGIVAAEWNRA